MTAKRTLLAVALAAAVLPYFIGLDATSIIDANEAFYTETPREMIETGDYINPRFNYEPRFNKPPLSYWVVAGCYKIFGVSLWSARLPIALGALLLLATVFVLGRLAFSAEAGLFAALTLAATPRFLLFSRRIIIDVHTAMYCGLTLLFFALAEFKPARRRLWLVLMYTAVGLGVLTKGPVNAVLPALAFAVYLVVAGRLHVVRRLMLPLGAVIVAGIVLPYYVAIYAEHGWTYISAFVLRENIGRFAEGAGAPYRGVFYYVPVVLLDLYFPWSVLLPAALATVPWRRVARINGWRRWSSLWWSREDPSLPATGDVRVLLAVWILTFVGFFSLSRAQQDLYVLPFVAAGAPLVGGLLDEWVRGEASSGVTRASTWLVFVVSLVLCGVGLGGVWFFGRVDAPVYLSGATLAGALLSAGAVLAAGLTLWRARIAAVTVLAVAIILTHWVVVLRTLPDFERYKHVPQLGRLVQERASPAAQVCTYKLATPSLVFYLRRHVFLIEDEGELRQMMRANAELYCMMREQDYEAIKGTLNVPTAVIAHVPVFSAQLEDFWRRAPLGRVVLVTNRPRGGASADHGQPGTSAHDPAESEPRLAREGHDQLHQGVEVPHVHHLDRRVRVPAGP